jgi:predicted thioredoxin/glutaredoxin
VTCLATDPVVYLKSFSPILNRDIISVAIKAHVSFMGILQAQILGY